MFRRGFTNLDKRHKLARGKERDNTFSLPASHKATLGQVPLAFLTERPFGVIFRRAWSELLGQDIRSTDMRHRNGTVRVRYSKDGGWGYKMYISVTRGTRTGHEPPSPGLKVLCCLTHPQPQPSSL